MLFVRIGKCFSRAWHSFERFYNKIFDAKWLEKARVAYDFRNRRLADDFRRRYGQTYRTVGQYYQAHKDEIQIAELVQQVPDFCRFVRVLER